MENDQEIQALIDKYTLLEKIVNAKMEKILKTTKNLPRVEIKHRVKTMDSIKEKMVRKSANYTSVSELRDILGFCIISLFPDDVDLIAKKISNYFQVDWSNSKDKRQLIDTSSFGYISLHYICALPEEEGELSCLWFEVQMMTYLQHCWASIEHDLGYKSEIEVPREIRRSFSRAASLLETTDMIFLNIKNDLDKYKKKVKGDIHGSCPEVIYFDAITLKEFTHHNEVYRNFLNEIAEITNAHIAEEIIHTENLLLQMSFLGIHTFADMIDVIKTEHDLALKLAKDVLKDSELDELSSTVAYFYLFRAKLIDSNFEKEKIRSFFMLTMKDEKSIEQNTKRVIEAREK